MIKILFVIPEYSHGGTNKSLENLLSLLDKDKYDISIYSLYEDGGDYYKEVFKPYIIKKSSLYYWLHDNVVTRKFLGLFNRITRRDHFTWLYKREENIIWKHYKPDIVVAYQEGLSTEFVSFFSSVKKIAWIHCDYANRTKGKRTKEGEIYFIYDNVVCVSNTAKSSFISLYPELYYKAWSIYNLLDMDILKKKAKQPIKDNSFNNRFFNIVSIGRLSSEKQFSLIPRIASQIKNVSRTQFHWYIIGEGVEKDRIHEEILKYDMSDIVKLLGAKDNPYPYIFHANLFVCTSISESFSYVIAEAKALHTPIVSNNFSTAFEVLDENTGWIINTKEMPHLLAKIINNVDGEYDSKKKTANYYHYSNDSILQKLNQLFTI